MTELQRKRTTVDQLQCKLESYLCVPQTHNHFEKSERLKSALNRIANNTDQLLSILRMNGITVMDNIDNVERQLEEFHILHQEVEQYLKTTRTS